MNKRKITNVVEVERKPFGDPHVLALAVIRGPDIHAIHRIVKPETTVGRLPEADFVLTDPLISGLHCCIRVNGSLFSLVDLGSTNGTLVNHTLVREGTRLRLKNFDEIQIGKTRMLFIANRCTCEPSLGSIPVESTP